MARGSIRSALNTRPPLVRPARRLLRRAVLHFGPDAVPSFPRTGGRPVPAPINTNIAAPLYPFEDQHDIHTGRQSIQQVIVGSRGAGVVEQSAYAGRRISQSLARRFGGFKNS